MDAITFDLRKNLEEVLKVFAINVVEVRKATESHDCAVIHFCVRDAGVGIPHEKQQMIFDAFSQADSSSTRKFGGTGLGLAISKRLIGEMSGQIWVESKIGSGSSLHFTVRLF